jgi:hypothetical protein
MKLRDTWIRLLKSTILFSALVVIFYSGVIFSGLVYLVKKLIH